MSDDVRKEIEKAISEGKRVFGNLKAFKKLRELGIEIPEETKTWSWEEYIDSIFSSEGKTRALARGQKLPQLPDLNVPSVIFLYREILKCIALGVNGAAITLSCVLVEYMLKYATFKIEMGGFKKYDEKKWSELEDLEFGQAVGRAARHGLISKSLKKELNTFREQIRNPYLHYNIARITSGIVERGVERLDLRTGRSEVVDIPARSDQTVQPRAKRYADDRQVLPVFDFANRVVIDLWEQIKHLQGS